LQIFTYGAQLLPRYQTRVPKFQQDSHCTGQRGTKELTYSPSVFFVNYAAAILIPDGMGYDTYFTTGFVKVKVRQETLIQVYSYQLEHSFESRHVPMRSLACEIFLLYLSRNEEPMILGKLEKGSL
jgi:hypothetical protein